LPGLGESAPATATIDRRLGLLIEEGVALAEDQSLRANELRNLIGAAVFSAFLLAYEAGRYRGVVPPSIDAARRYIEARYPEPIAVEAVAREAGITRQHLTAGFKRYFGTTPVRYLWQLRAEAAAHRLVHTSETATSIAYACGYKDPFHFSRHLRRVYGMPPNAIRKTGGFRPSSKEAEAVQEVSY
jgi:AraC family L-rhamnose operon regulatory protein RhaS